MACLAQDAGAAPIYSGEIASRSRLTGDWGGLRNELARKGIELDIDMLATPIDVVSGGRGRGASTWANVDATLNLDTEKLGWWKGGVITLQADSGLGSMNPRSGSIVAINAATLVPGADERTTVLMNATLTQAITDAVSIAVGKFNTFDQGAQEFYGDYSSQFLNGAFNYPVTTEQVPQSAFGAGVVLAPTRDIAVSGYVLDSRGSPDSNDLGHAFDDGAMATAGLQWTVHPQHLTGHQGFSVTWSNTDRLSLEQSPSNLATMLLQGDFPRLGDLGVRLAPFVHAYFPQGVTSSQPVNMKGESWSWNYAFDQYLWQPAGDNSHGVGIFFSVGASDGNPNPVHYAYLAGVGGKGCGSARPDDSYGIGVARTSFSGAFIPFLRQQLGLGLDHEDAFEAYYNVALTGWLHATADVQWVDPALKKALTRDDKGLVNVGAAAVIGLRFRVRF